MAPAQEDFFDKVRIIASGPNGDLLRRLVDLLYEREEEYFSPEDLAAIQEGLDASLKGDRTQFVSWEDLKKELGL